MIYLILSILCTTVIYLLFQLFQRFKVDLFPAIVINYFTCTVIAPFFSEQPFTEYLSNIPQALFSFSILLGLSFICVFYLMSSTTQLLGVAGGTIVSRMSMIIPAGFGVIYLQEPFTIVKGIGILLALSAIYFTVGLQKRDDVQDADEPKKNSKLWLPVSAFIGVGLVDTLLKISQVKFFGNRADNNFVGLTYFWALVAGLCILAFFKTEDFKLLLKKKNLLWGFLLGLPNYFGIIWFYKTLTTPNLHASTIFPVNSVGIVAFSTIAAIIFLREKVNLYKIIGLGLAVGAIVLLSA
ncbi:MAG: EamA family transporter [Bacteroidia bacterium]